MRSSSNIAFLKDVRRRNKNPILNKGDGDIKSYPSKLSIALCVILVILYFDIYRFRFLLPEKLAVIAMNVLAVVVCVDFYFHASRNVRILMRIFLGIWLFTVFQVLMYCFVKPHTTPTMLIQKLQSGKHPEYKLQRPISYVNVDQISPYLIQAADIGEDGGKFMFHRGFRIDKLILCYLSNEEGNPIRGGSTISQQTAKNCFLLPNRTILRKLVEAHYTTLIELFWGKKRIMERYLNIIEFGPGIFGCEAASQYYFQHSASQLTSREAALLIASLPSPRVSNPNHFTPLYKERLGEISMKMKEDPMTDLNKKRVDQDPVRVAQYSRGLLYFARWLVFYEGGKLWNSICPSKKDGDMIELSVQESQ